MRTIWKLNLGAESYVVNRDRRGPLPAGATVLGAGLVLGRGPYLWVEVDTTHENEERLFHLVATGLEVPADAEHVVTCYDDDVVMHIYETRRPTAAALDRAIRLREEE